MKDMKDMKASYTKLFLMILSSAIAMYIVMYANVFSFSHAYTALMRIYMALLMTVPMIIIMLWFMRSMYGNKKTNQIIIVLSLLLGWALFLAIRNQSGIYDTQWLRAMIPHHSSAILTSSRVKFQDAEVKKLADEIIAAQEKEIAIMKKMLEKFE